MWKKSIFIFIYKMYILYDKNNNYAEDINCFKNQFLYTPLDNKNSAIYNYGTVSKLVDGPAIWFWVQGSRGRSNDFVQVITNVTHLPVRLNTHVADMTSSLIKIEATITTPQLSLSNTHTKCRKLWTHRPAEPLYVLSAYPTIHKITISYHPTALLHRQSGMYVK